MPKLDIEICGSFPVTIYYEDTDFSGFVYHANYLKYFERAREEMIGVKALRSFYESGVHFVVTSLDMRFLRAAKHGDHLNVRSTCRFSHSPSHTYNQTVHLDNEVLVEANIKIACLNKLNRPTRMPEEVLNHLQLLSKRT